MSTDPPETRYAVVVPVKPPAVGKSRLGLGDTDRRPLAEAFALDTVAAALTGSRVDAVLVVTDDAAFSTALTALGAHAIPDGVSLDLNATLREGAAEAVRRWPDLVPVALCADLPALRPADLDLALAEVGEIVAAGGAAYVSDTEGTGTTLYAAALPGFEPRFGAGSAAAHRALGAHDVAAEVATLRRDVDDLDELEQARALGLGARTSALDPSPVTPPSAG